METAGNKSNCCREVRLRACRLVHNALRIRAAEYTLPLDFPRKQLYVLRSDLESLNSFVLGIGGLLGIEVADAPWLHGDQVDQEIDKELSRVTHIISESLAEPVIPGPDHQAKFFAELGSVFEELATHLADLYQQAQSADEDVCEPESPRQA